MRMSGAQDKRHPATAPVWEWLEREEGRSKPRDVRERVAAALAVIDRTFLEWETPREPARFPAVLLVHWPSGPVACCASHGVALSRLGAFMGVHIVCSALPAPDVGFVECVNCQNEGPPEREET